MSTMQKQLSPPRMALGFPTVSHFLWANLLALGKHSLPDLPARPSVLVSEYYSLHLLSSGKG